MKKGFTLIELLGVIILLAIISLMATPIILNVVNDAQESADMTTAQLIVSSGHNYYAASLFDEAKKMKIDNLADVYNEIEMTNKPTTGQLYVNNNDQVAIAVIINNKCYKKNFLGDIEVVGTSECDLGFVGQDEIAPTISQEVINTPINSNDWYKEDLYIKVNVTDNESGVAGYKRCMGSNECTPDSTIYNVSNQIYINTESDSNYVCVIGVDNYGNESDKECIIYKLDKTVPTAGTATFTGTLGSNDWYTTNVTVNVANGSDSLSGHSNTSSNVSSITSNTTGTTVTITTTDLAGNSATRNYTIKVDKDSPSLVAKDGVVEITEGDSNVVSNFFTVSYGISGGSMSCTPTNTSGLTVGTQTLRCTATGGNGLTTTATKQITVNPDTYFVSDTSGANIPELLTNMIPIVYDGTNWIYSDGTQENWYSYDEKSWANAVVLNSDVNKNVGDTITEDEIALWYVWIPRYKYQLFNANNGSVAEQLINIEFESETATTGTVSCSDAVSGLGSSSETCTNATNGNWYTHPAFTFGTKEVTGFWVGKFEVSGNVSAITIKPGVSSLTGQTVSAFFTAIQNMKNTYSLSGDSHMMKNMEWGAVAYLKQSKYGLGTTDITINSNYYTGGGSSSTSYKSNTRQSTTGTVYGVYDMSGGIEEYVMGNMVNSSGNFYDSSAGFGGSVLDTKYYDKYTNGSSSTMHGLGKLGDATKETLTTFGYYRGGWYSDSASFVNLGYSWFLRGGIVYSDSYAGIFSFINSNGSISNGYSTRAVLTP